MKKLLGSALSVLMACLIVGHTDAQETFNVFFLMRDIESMSEGDEAQLEYFENREDIDFIDLWDNNRIQDDSTWQGLTPLEWADALDLVWIDESVSSGRVPPIQDTTTPIINNENFACDVLGTLDPPDGDDDHGSPGSLKDGIPIPAGTHFGTDILIVDDTHPIAVGAGLSNGVHTIYDDQGLGDEGGGRMSWCTPGDEARIVALFPEFAADFPKASPIFVYEEGDELADGRIAPGMRIGSFLSDTNRGPPPPDNPLGGTDGSGPGFEATLLTDAGWALVESMVNYALGISDITTPDCDFDGDGACDGPDIDALMNEVAAGTNGATFDLTADGLVNDADRDAWLAEAGPRNGFLDSFLLGDSNLDGSVNATDLNEVGLTWQSDNSNWSNGNFTGAGTNAADLNAMALNWQQSVPVAAAAESVPEPAAIVLLVIGLAGITCRHRRCT